MNKFKKQSIETVGTVITEQTAERTEKFYQMASPKKQYEFAVSFLKVGDYETAELALREFVDTNPQHHLLVMLNIGMEKLLE